MSHIFESISRMNNWAKAFTGLLLFIGAINATVYGAYKFMDSRLESKINTIVDSKIQVSNALVVVKLNQILDSINESNEYNQIVLKRNLEKQAYKIKYNQEDVKWGDVENCLDDYPRIKIKSDRVQAYHSTVYSYYVKGSSSHRDE